MPVTRRDWMRMASGAAIGAALTGRVQAEAGRTFCLFSKHLPELDWMLVEGPDRVCDHMLRLVHAAGNHQLNVGGGVEVAHPAVGKS